MAKLNSKSKIDFQPIKDIDFQPIKEIDFQPISSTAIAGEPSKGPSIGGAIGQLAIGAVDEAFLGYPLKTLEKYKGEKNVKEYESPYPIERFARGAGREIGFAGGWPLKVFKSL